MIWNSGYQMQKCAQCGEGYLFSHLCVMPGPRPEPPPAVTLPLSPIGGQEARIARLNRRVYLLEQALKAACDFIEASVGDPMTQEMSDKRAELLRARKELDGA